MNQNGGGKTRNKTNKLNREYSLITLDACQYLKSQQLGRMLLPESDKQHVKNKATNNAHKVTRAPSLVILLSILQVQTGREQKMLEVTRSTQFLFIDSMTAYT